MSNTTTISVLRGCRAAIHKIAADLSPEQMLAVPDGFDNNIAWNIGHIIIATESILYKRAGVPVTVSDEMVAMYKPGTSPADWSANPDTNELLDMLMNYQQKLEDDYAAGLFEGRSVETLTSSTGIVVDDFDGSLVFDVYHHSQHYGMIMALNNFVGK